ncbi:MAG: hypothetical protein ACXWXA_10770 [Candidatus Limnocylindrales bacterium]
MRILAPLLITVAVVAIAIAVVTLQKRFVVGTQADVPAAGSSDDPGSESTAPSSGEVLG